MIEICDLVFEYPTGRALSGVSLTVEQGTITALVGRNGAGKTTLLRCMAALETPYRGRVVIDGLDTQARPRAVHARLGYLPDFFGLYDALTVRHCLTYAARAHGVTAGRTPEAVSAAAARVGLTDRLDQAAGTLSRGLRQRLAIGQALVHDPKVLLLDEPAAGLDPEARRDLSRLLLALQANGMTLVVSSHILAELEEYCSRMVIIDNGVIAGGAPVTLREGARKRLRIALARPHDGLRDFLARDGAMEILECDAAHAVVALDAGAAARADLLARLIEAGFAVSDFGDDGRALEDVYFRRVKP